MNRATETDSARALSPSKTLALGRATEIDVARPISLTTFEPLGRATETGNARGLTAAKSVALGRSAQADAARLLAASKTSAVGKATETDQARGFGVITGQSIGRVSEADSARTFSTSKVVALGRATETDAARSFLLGIPDPNVIVSGQVVDLIGLAGAASTTVALEGQGWRAQSSDLRERQLMSIGQQDIGFDPKDPLIKGKTNVFRVDVPNLTVADVASAEWVLLDQSPVETPTPTVEVTKTTASGISL